MTSQDQANEILAIWQAQARLGIPAKDRHLPLPANDRDAFDRDLEIIRKCMERVS